MSAFRSRGPVLSNPLTLHIGLPKTASTFLQGEVFPALQRHAYVDCPRTRIVHPAPRGETDRLFERVLAREPGLWSAIGPALLDEVVGQQTGDRPVLVSDEAIGRQASSPLRLAAHLSALDRLAQARGFAPMRLIVVIREQASWFASHFVQYSDRRPNSDQAAFVDFVRRQTDPADGFHRFGALLQYDVVYDALAGALSEDRVEVLLVEELRADPATFTARIEAFLGDRLTPTASPQRRRNVRSVGQDRWELRPPPLAKPLQRLRFTLRGPAGRHIALTPELRKAAEAYAESNANLSRRTGLDLARHGYVVKGAS